MFVFIIKRASYVAAVSITPPTAVFVECSVTRVSQRRLHLRVGVLVRHYALLGHLATAELRSSPHLLVVFGIPYQKGKKRGPIT